MKERNTEDRKQEKDSSSQRDNFFYKLIIHTSRFGFTRVLTCLDVNLKVTEVEVKQKPILPEYISRVRTGFY